MWNALDTRGLAVYLVTAKAEAGDRDDDGKEKGLPISHVARLRSQCVVKLRRKERELRSGTSFVSSKAAYVRKRNPNLVIQYVLYSIPLIMYARAIVR